MKFSPTLTLALALATGVAGAAAAQTIATSPPAGTTNAQPGWNSSHPQSSYARPQPSYGQPGTMPQGYAQPNADPSAAATAAGQGGADPQLMAAQQRLKALGLYSGPADGIMDPDTRAALANFQRQHGLRNTEGLDQQTMAALSSAQPTATGTSAGPSTASPPTGMLNNAPAPTAAGGNTGTPPTASRTPTTGEAPAR